MIDDNKKNRTDNNEGGEETKIYLTPESTLQTPEEHKHDQGIDPRKDDTMEVSDGDLRETETDRYRNSLLGTDKEDKDL